MVALTLDVPEPAQAQLENHGSIWLLRPLDGAAREWLNETAPSDAQFFGDALVIEPRYVPGVIEAFTSAGGELC
jgi:hypothetical protein